MSSTVDINGVRTLEEEVVIAMAERDETAIFFSETHFDRQNPEPAAVNREEHPVSGRALQTWRDGWTYCKATKKVVARNQWLPRLNLVAAVVTALTGTAIFATIQVSQSTAARVAVGSIVALTAVVSAVTAWVGSRIKGLNDQAHRFHEFHRKVQADFDAGRDLTEPGYEDRIEHELNGITAGMSEPSNKAWREAKAEMEHDIQQTCPDLLPHRRVL
ncbi:hypothetical protein [Nocardia nova]|uniref:hypothetical protein n=1 Tax=Nocardia nova TaxID=37330 RepID=UPI000AA3DCBA|nr:hypothetical protein [Nocardia nova]